MRMNKVLVTGASSGIGLATALLLHQQDMKVFAGVRNEEDAELLRRIGCTPVQIDVRDEEQVAAAFDFIAGEVQVLDGLVNNAGIGLVGALEEVRLEDVENLFQVNVMGSLRVTQHALPLLRSSQGHLVQIASTAGRLPTPLLGAYGASKAALILLSETLRLETSQFGIEVTIVEPGNIATPIWEKTLMAKHGLVPQPKTPPSSSDAQQPGVIPEGGQSTSASGSRAVTGSRATSGLARAIDHARSSKRASDSSTKPQAATEWYDQLYVRALEFLATAELSSPFVVAEKVLLALTKSSPRRRYIVGKHSRLETAVASLPGRVRDALIFRMFHLK